MSQKAKVLGHLKRYGSITNAVAFSKYEITCLQERIRDLREAGHDIPKDMIRTKKKTFARYRLA